MNPIKRRTFLKFLGKGSAVAIGSSLYPFSLIAKKNTISLKRSHKIVSVPFLKFDDVRLIEGLEYKVLISCFDSISDTDTFGMHNDYLAFIPLNKSGNEGLLWVNHEYLDPVLINTEAPLLEKTLEQIKKEQYVVGGSIIHIIYNEGNWTVKKDSSYNKRITANTSIPFLWDEAIAGSHSAIGTFSNCAGGVTPWGSILTCEENTDMMYGEYIYDAPGGSITGRKNSVYGWETHFNYPLEHYGWVVEVDVKTGKAQKLPALGRFAHECATVIQPDTGGLVIYTGDDGNDRCLYKYVSKQHKDLQNGTLYVANIEKGEWISLKYNDHKILQKHFKNQTEVLIRAREASILLGGTPLNRPEDIEIDPKSGDIFISLTNNTNKGDYHGSILKLREGSKDKKGTSFKASTYIVGGLGDGFSCPDNLAFDPKGNLWFTTDVSGSKLGKGKYEFFPCNGLFVIPRKGKQKGEVLRIATAPNDAEFTGPFFHPVNKELFLSVQHPGETSKSLDKLTSNWPEGGKSVPKSSVIVISGKALEAIF